VETRIKERLTGALILVAALVILVPEIFSGRRLNEPGREPSPAAPPASEGPPLRSYTTEVDAAGLPSIATPAETPPPVAVPPVSAAAPPDVAAPSLPAAETRAPPPPVVETRPSAPEKPASVARADSPAAKPAAKPADKPATSAGEWFVQVGSFSQAENAERYAQQLRKQGFSAIVLPPAGAKSLVRVRVGPVRSRDAAAALLERLTASGHKGAVVGS
jgi:DedD protein